MVIIIPYSVTIKANVILTITKKKTFAFKQISLHFRIFGVK